MGEVSIIGLGLAKNVFQAHGDRADGSVVFSRKLSRTQLLNFMASQPPCVVAMAYKIAGLDAELQQARDDRRQGPAVDGDPGSGGGVHSTATAAGR